MTRKLAIFSTVAIAALSVALTSAPSSAADIIGLVTKTNTNPFFVKMKEGAQAKAKRLVRELERHVASVRRAAARLARRPRVYFEEWDEPQICGIQWVSELIGIAGGEDIFRERAAEPLGKNRILADPDEVIRRQPDIILGSWCGKRFVPKAVAARVGWQAIPAVRDGELHEIKSPLILQPGPAALTDGLDAMFKIISRWAARDVAHE